MEPRPASGYGRWPHSGYPAQPSPAPLSQQPGATPGGNAGGGGGGGGPPTDASAQQQPPPQPTESAAPPPSSSAPPPASSPPDAGGSAGGAGATGSGGGGSGSPGGGGGAGGGAGAPPPGVVPSPTAAAGGPADGGFPPAQQQPQQHHAYYGHAPPPQQLARPRVTSREELSYVADYVGIPLTTWQVDMLMKIGESYHAEPQPQHHYQQHPRPGGAGGAGGAAAATGGWATGGGAGAAGGGAGGGGAGSPPPPPHQQGPPPPPPPPPHQQQAHPPTHHGGGGGGYNHEGEVWNYGPWGAHDGGDCAACHEEWCDAYKEEEFVKLDDSDLEGDGGSSEGEDVMPPLEKAPVVSVQSPGYTQGWWGRGREPDFGAVRNEQRLAKLLARRESRRRKDKLRRLDKDACRIKHERKVLHALSTQSVKEYQQDEIVQMCKDGSLLHKKANEVVFDYVVFNLPERGVITCPLSGLQKISSAVCVRRDLIRDGSGLSLTGCPALEGPQIISTREYTNLSKRDPPLLDPAVLEYVPDSEKEGYQLTNLANDILQTRKGPGNTTNVRQ